MKKLFPFFIISLIFISSVNGAIDPGDLSGGVLASCDNVGDIQNDQYCSVDGFWENLKPNNNFCENNFECLSENCIEGYCSETSVKEEYEKQKSLLNQILAFLSGEDTNGDGTNGDGTTNGAGTSGGGSRTSGSGDDYSITKTFSKVIPYRLYCFNINELPIPVTKICFISNTESEDVKFEVERQLERTSGISKPGGLIYQYLTIDVENLPNQYIEKADITFRVTKDWIDQNNLKTYKVTLQKLLSDWNTLKPQVIAEDNVYYYYNSLTNGFSWFALTSLPSKPKYIPPIAEQVCGDGIIDLEENCENCPEDVVCEDDEYCYESRCVLKKKTPILRYLIPLLLILLIIVLILVLRRRKKSLVVIKEKKPMKKLAPVSANKFKSASNGKSLISKVTLFPSKIAEKNLRNYIKKALKTKMTKKKIKTLLVSKGWKSEQVEYIFKQLKK